MSSCANSRMEPYDVCRLRVEFEGEEQPWEYPLALNGRKLAKLSVDGVDWAPVRAIKIVLDEHGVAAMKYCGERFEKARECGVVGTVFDDLADQHCHSLSCGHDTWTEDAEPPRYCGECGARVRRD